MLAVSDDGRGFDTAATAAGAGLTGMHERALLVDGDAERRRPRPAPGTTVRLEVAGAPVADGLVTRVLLADDHAVVRQGLRLVLDAQPDLRVVAEAGRRRSRRSGSGWREDVDLAILDVAMPGLTGLQAAQELTRRRPGLRVLMLSMHAHEQYLYEALQARRLGLRAQVVGRPAT